MPMSNTRIMNKGFLLRLFGIQCPHWSTIALWTTGIAIMTALTVKDLRPIVMEYYDADQNTQIQIKIRKFEENPRGPDLYLCIPLETGYLSDFTNALIFNLTCEPSECSRGWKPCTLCGNMTKHSYDVWNRVDLHLNKSKDESEDTRDERIIANLGRAFRAKVLEDGIANTSINVANLDWNYPIINSIVSYLNTESSIERRMLISGSVNYPYEEKVIRHVDSFDPKPLDFFYSLLTSLMCEFVEFHNSSETVTHDQCRELLRDSSIVWNNHYCTRLPLAYTKHFVVAFERKEKNFFKSQWVKTAFEPYEAKQTKFLVLTENPTLHDEEYNFANNLCKSPDGLGQPDGQSVTLTYSLPSSAVEGRPHKMKTCYDESSASECEWNRRLERLAKHCDCALYVYQSRSLSPSSSKKVIDTSKGLCITSTDNRTLHNFWTECFRNGSQTYPYGANFDECTDPCRSSSYQWQASALPHSPFTFVNRSFELKIRPSQETYVEFISTVKDSSEDFISHIGGVFNFYLGLSGLSIIFFLIYLFDVGRRYYRLQERGEEFDGNNSMAIGWWNWRWMQVAATIADNNRDKTSDLAALRKDVHEKMDQTEMRINEKIERMKSEMELMVNARLAELSNETIRTIQA